jgi:hypothetical protein
MRSTYRDAYNRSSKGNFVNVDVVVEEDEAPHELDCRAKPVPCIPASHWMPLAAWAASFAISPIWARPAVGPSRPAYPCLRGQFAGGDRGLAMDVPDVASVRHQKPVDAIPPPGAIGATLARGHAEY